MNKKEESQQKAKKNIKTGKNTDISRLISFVLPDFRFKYFRFMTQCTEEAQAFVFLLDKNAGNYRCPLRTNESNLFFFCV
ncbi:MAG: hypothetical protein ACREWI_02055 [Telluria sp.]